MKFLILYGTKQGQTRKIAQSIADHLVRKGNSVDLIDSQNIKKTIIPLHYDAILVGASIHASGYPKKLKKWIQTNHTVLNQMPSAFFSVCLGILQKEERVQSEVRAIMQNLFSETKWTPTTSTIFAGALSYSQYNWFLKRVMKRIAEKAGVETDTSRDYEYTNWGDVTAFTERFSQSLKQPLQTKSQAVDEAARLLQN